MPKKHIGMTVFDAAVERMEVLYRAGHRIIVSFSAGKDSTAVLGICTLAAQRTGCLPVEVFMQDEEINLPGTYEYAQRVADRDDTVFHWVTTNMPMLNVFNREHPFWWMFDPALDQDDWVRRPPEWAVHTPEFEISNMTTPDIYPPPPGKDLIVAMGLRVSESQGRLMGLYSSKGYLTKRKPTGQIYARPIYDWADGDIWKAIADNGWDYNSAYDQMARIGRPRSKVRIAPPTMNVYGIKDLQLAQRVWPRWFDRVATRCPGVRSAAAYGDLAAKPRRGITETWQDCFHRQNIDHAPEWIRDRSIRIRDLILKRHSKHSAAPFPDIAPCYQCDRKIGSWKQLALVMFNGDPYCTRCGNTLPFMDPAYFRPDMGGWEKRS